MKARCFLFFLIASLVTSAGHALAGDPAITIQVGAKRVVETRSQLVKSSQIQKIEVKGDPTYGSAIRQYEAMPVVELFEKIVTPQELNKLVREKWVLEFTCLDGFSASLPIDLVMNQNRAKAIAYIAIEPLNAKWPNVKGSKTKTAGPFYLIWKNADRSNIGPEQWPYQLANLTVKPPVASRYPKIVPATKNRAVIAGYRLFVKNCFTCHTLNGEGDSRLGPDLNIPMSPTEYLRAGMIRRLVRNPQNLRKWPESKMSSFSASQLSDRDINRIVDYLRFMAKHRE